MPTISKQVALIAAVVLGALCAGPAAAGAHPLLVTSAPAPGALVPGSPSTLTLAFSEPSVPAGSALTVTGPGRRAVAIGRLRSTAGGQQLAAALPDKLRPGVYQVHWVALGVDGHTVSGDFAFGVAEPNGEPPPGAAAGLGTAETAGRGGNAAGQSVPSIILLWLGVLAASTLWGGALLVHALRVRRVPGAEKAGLRLGPLSRLALISAVVSAVYGLFQQSDAGAGGLDFGLLTASGTGISALTRAALALAGGVGACALAHRRAERRACALCGPLGGLLLISYGLSGHVLAQGSALAALGMAIHVLAAGTWAGGLVVLLVLVRGEDGIALKPAGRAFAPIAGSALGIAALTGAIAAIREVSHWYFLWWSGYGRVVIIKVAVVALASAAAAVTFRRARRSALGLESGLVVAVVAIAAVLAGLAQGRGQPLPSQRGDLLPGPALANLLLPSGPTPVTLAPARPGMNTIVVIPKSPARSIEVRLVCGCDIRPVISLLHPDPGSPGAFSARIPVPDDGTWNAYVAVDGAPASEPVALPVGVSGAPGAPVRNVLAIADLSGPGAARCTNYLVGAELAIGRLNGSGGVDGGAKVTLEAYDDAGSEAQGASAAEAALHGAGGGQPVALLPCGAGAEDAIAVAARAGVPTIAGDPATGTVAGARVYRLAADPYADGFAIAQAIGAEVLPVSVRGARTVDVLAASDAQGRRRFEGLEQGLSALHPTVHVRMVSASMISSSTGEQLLALLSRSHTVALVIDATDSEDATLAGAFHRLPARQRVFAPAPVLASERALSEGFVEGAGDAGRLGVIEGTSTVAVDSRDGLTLSQALPALFPGENASLEGLRGYVAGLALDYGLGDGTTATSVASRLREPPPFTDAIAQPWLATAPAGGARVEGLLEPNFLTTTLQPVSSGGEPYSGLYFPDGAWERPVTSLFGVPAGQSLPPLGG